MNNLISEVAVVSAQEKAMLGECEALLNFATAVQVRPKSHDIWLKNLSYAQQISQMFYVENEHKLVGNKFHLHSSHFTLSLILFDHLRGFNVRSHK